MGYPHSPRLPPSLYTLLPHYPVSTSHPPSSPCTLRSPLFADTERVEQLLSAAGHRVVILGLLHGPRYLFLCALRFPFSSHIPEGSDPLPTCSSFGCCRQGQTAPSGFQNSVSPIAFLGRGCDTACLFFLVLGTTGCPLAPPPPAQPPSPLGRVQGPGLQSHARAGASPGTCLALPPQVCSESALTVSILAMALCIVAYCGRNDSVWTLWVVWYSGNKRVSHCDEGGSMVVTCCAWCVCCPKAEFESDFQSRARVPRGSRRPKLRLQTHRLRPCMVRTVAIRFFGLNHQKLRRVFFFDGCVSGAALGQAPTAGRSHPTGTQRSSRCIAECGAVWLCKLFFFLQGALTWALECMSCPQIVTQPQ